VHDTAVTRREDRRRHQPPSASGGPCSSHPQA
jgi:hypothetical protein